MCEQLVCQKQISLTLRTCICIQSTARCTVIKMHVPISIFRNASKKEITKAYRKLAAEWHPDRYDGKEKEEAEKKFIDIAAAKEVLTDPEKRQKFDNGEDPLDPEEQAQGGGPFWHQGFNPFGGGGFQFKFHF